MGINRNLLSIKSHFFLYWGFMASAPPFVMVVARQIGVSLGVQGVVSSVITVAAVLLKPFIAALTDTFPAQRKIIFLALITIMIAAYNPIGFLPPLQPSPHLSGQLMSITLPVINLNINNSRTSLHLLTPRQHQQALGECVVIEAWDCFAFCQNGEPCPALTYLSSGFKFSLRPSHDDHIAEQMENITVSLPMSTRESLTIRHTEEMTPATNLLKEWQSSPNHTWGKENSKDMAYGTQNLNENQTMVYIIEGVGLWDSKTRFNVSIECQGGVYGKEDGDKEICVPAVFNHTGFWIYVILLLVAYITATTVESISDAICCDTISEGESYGHQRVWGVLSYGLLGALSGLLVDWRSGDSTIRDYRPAFFLMTACGVLDFLLSAATLKVPKLEAQQKGMRANLGPLLRQIHFLIFLVTTFFIGLFDGLDTGFLFVLQEDIAERIGTSGQHVNVVQGLTLLAQALSAIPCMFLCDWFMQRFGAKKVISTVLFLYSIRLLSLAGASHLGVLWITVLVEMINGPCFGLGYTAIVVHASSLAPRGYSTTVQSVVGVCYGTLGYAGASFVGGAMYEVMGGEWLYLVTGGVAFFIWTIHVFYITVSQKVARTKGLEPAEAGREKDPEDPQGMVRLDTASPHLVRKEESTGDKIVEKKEEIEVLLEN